MAKDITTLIPDIEKLVTSGTDVPAPTSMSNDIALAYSRQLRKRSGSRKPDTLFFSELGSPCDRKLWYGYHKQELAEPIPPSAKVKFMYGDMLESLVLQLCRDAGHSVTDEQREVEYNVPGTKYRVRGRIDAVVDGLLVDVKSVTKHSEKKFYGGLRDDPFGYYAQLNGYASVMEHTEAGFLTIQKELGHIKMFPIKQSDTSFATSVARAVGVVELSDTAMMTVPRLEPVDANSAGTNKKLCTTCSYCPYKYVCWEGELRAFSYSGKVELLTQVASVPRVPELNINELRKNGGGTEDEDIVS